MPVLNSLKRQFRLDIAFVAVLAVAAMVFIWASGLNLPGWDIKGKNIILDEDKTESRDIFIREGGSLLVDGAELTLKSSFQYPLNVHLEGDSMLKLKNASLVGEDGIFILTLSPKEDTNPSVKIADSELVNADGIFMYGNSFLKATNSDIGVVFLREDASVECDNSVLSLSLTADKGEILEGLVPANDVTGSMKSDLGWKVELDSCDVSSYQVEIYEDDDVTIKESRDVIVQFQSPGTLEEMFEFDGNSISSTTGELSSAWFSLNWVDTTYSFINFVANGTDDLTIRNVRVGNIDALETSKVRVEGGSVRCKLCKISGNAKLTLDGVSNDTDSKAEGRIFVTGFGELLIRNSDVRGIRIVVSGEGDLAIENSTFDQDSISVEGSGTYSVDGVSMNEDE